MRLPRRPHRWTALTATAMAVGLVVATPAGADDSPMIVEFANLELAAFDGVPYALELRSIVDARPGAGPDDARSLILDGEARDDFGRPLQADTTVVDLVRRAFETRFPTAGAVEVLPVDVRVDRFDLGPRGFWSGAQRVAVELTITGASLPSRTTWNGDEIDVGYQDKPFRSEQEVLRRDFQTALEDVTEGYARALNRAWERDRPEAPRPNLDLENPVTPGIGQMAWRGAVYGAGGLGFVIMLGGTGGEFEPGEIHEVLSFFYATGAGIGVSKGNNGRGNGLLVAGAVTAAYAANVAAFDLTSHPDRWRAFWVTTVISTTGAAILAEMLSSDDDEVFVRDRHVTLGWVDGPGVVLSGSY